jgi:hypothetical protein
MSDPIKREKPQTIKEMRQESSAWENYHPTPIAQFQISNTYWVGVPFHSVTSTECIEREDKSCEMSVEWKDGDKVRCMFVTGPKVPELFSQFCLNLVSVIRADGKDITRVTLLAPRTNED